MTSLTLTSILVATLVIPLLFAGDRIASRGLRKVVLAMFAFNILYLLALLFLYPRLLG